MWLITILVALLQIIGPSLLKLDLFCKPVSFNLTIFGNKNGGDFREKIISIGTISTFVDIRF